MPRMVFTANQVKECLHDLGYDIEDRYLDRFIHDLKKLIKHDVQKRRRMRLGHEEDDTNLTGLTAVGTNPSEGSPDNLPRQILRQLNHMMPEKPSHQDKIDGKDSKSHVHERETESTTKEKKKKSKDKKSKKEKCSETELRIPDNSHAIGLQNHIVDKENANSGNVSKSKKKKHVKDETAKAKRATSDGIIVIKDVEESRRKTKIDAAKKAKSHENRNANEPSKTHAVASKTRSETEYSDRLMADLKLQRAMEKMKSKSLNCEELIEMLDDLIETKEEVDLPDDTSSNATYKLRKGPSKKIQRDPVLLYNYYKKFWDSARIPGEEKHMKLRWNVRADTAGKFPCIRGQPIKYLRT